MVTGGCPFDNSGCRKNAWTGMGLSKNSLTVAAMTQRFYRAAAIPIRLFVKELGGKREDLSVMLELKRYIRVLSRARDVKGLRESHMAMADLS
jgi:hypothetical protein